MGHNVLNTLAFGTDMGHPTTHNRSRMAHNTCIATFPLWANSHFLCIFSFWHNIKAWPVKKRGRCWKAGETQCNESWCVFSNWQATWGRARKSPAGPKSRAHEDFVRPPDGVRSPLGVRSPIGVSNVLLKEETTSFGANRSNTPSWNSNGNFRKKKKEKILGKFGRCYKLLMFCTWAVNPKQTLYKVS